MVAPIPDDPPLLAARRVPLIQSSVAEFAALHSPASLSTALSHALTTAGIHAATVLAVAASHQGELLDPDVVLPLVSEVDSIDLVGPLVFASRVTHQRRRDDVSVPVREPRARGDRDGTNAEDRGRARRAAA